MSINAIGSSLLGMVPMMALVWLGLALLLFWGIRHLFPMSVAALKRWRARSLGVAMRQVK